MSKKTSNSDYVHTILYQDDQITINQSREDYKLFKRLIILSPPSLGKPSPDLGISKIAENGVALQLDKK